jgi:outer membrane receptor protein involved in Fe transport
MRFHVGYVTVGAAVGAVLCGAPALAQVKTDSGLAEVVVTARKVEESVQDVPIAVSIVNAEMLRRAEIKDVFELTRMLPNVSINETYGRTFDRPSIRGQTNIVGERTVGLFIDGIYIAGSISSTDLLQVERVEVLRGPQTALFGRGTLAGAINYITRRPTERFEGTASASLGSEGLVDASASLSGPLDDAARWRYAVSGRYYTFDGWHRNSGLDGGDVGSQETKSGSFALSFQPSDTFDATLRGGISNDNDGIWPLRLLTTLNCFQNSGTAGRGGYFCGTVPEISRDGIATDFNINDQVDPGVQKQTNRVSLALRWELGSMEFTSLSAWAHEREDWWYDDGQVNSQTGPYRQSGPNPGFLARLGRDWVSKSQEFHLTSSTDQRARWLLGAFGYREDKEEFANNPTVINGVVQSVAKNPDKQTENLAFFGRIEYDLLPTLTGTVEARYARDELSFDLATGSVTRTFNSTTPRVSLSWKPVDSMTYYASFAQGTRPGDVNTNLYGPTVPASERARLSGFIEVDEEETDNYELGAKAWLLDRDAYVELAVFQIDWRKQQLTASEVYTNTAGRPANISLIQNAGETRIRGAEFSFLWQALQSLQMSGSFGLADAEFVEYCDATQVPLTGTCSVKGNRPPGTPRVTGAFTVIHRFELGAANALVTSADYTHQGSRFDQAGNFAETGASDRINARVAYETGPWTVAVWGKNLTNERSAESIVRFFNPDSGFAFTRAFQVRYPIGRTWGATASYRF